MKTLQTVTIATVGLLIVTVVGIGLWSLFGQANNVPVEQSNMPVEQVADERRGIPNRPYVEPILDRGDLLEVRGDGSVAVVGIGPISEFRASQLAKNVPLKIPSQDVLPDGFAVRWIFYENSTSTYEFEGQKFSPEILRMYLLDRNIGPEERDTDVLGGGGISITITYALGSNETATELFKTMNRDLIYINGFPTLVAENYIELFDFEENVLYEVIGNYSKDVLLKIVDSLINRG